MPPMYLEEYLQRRCEPPLNNPVPPLLIRAETYNDDSLTDLLSRNFSLFSHADSYFMFDSALKARRFERIDAESDIYEMKTVEQKYLEPAILVANRIFHAREFATSYSFSVEANGNRLWETAVVSAWIIRDGGEPVDRKNICAAIFVAAGNLDTADFMLGTKEVKAKVVVRRLIAELRMLCIENRCRCGFLTDGSVSVLYHHAPDFDPELAFINIVSKDKDAGYGPQKTLVYAIWKEALRLNLSAFLGRPIPHFCQGVLDTRPRLCPVSDAELMTNRRSFEDFDLYTMQRDSNALDEFLHWKEIAESYALNAPLVPGTTLAVKPSAFFARHALLRSPYPPGAPPRETLNVVTQHHRPRCTKLDDILATEPTPTFEITSVVRSGPNHWSQVFFGRVRGSSQLVCLKLFDDRLFHLPDLDDYDDCPPERRLQTFNRATDMMRREESVYDRLTHLQGSLVPHCYGFHEFVLPDGWHLWGLFTEVIDGPPLLDLPLGKYPSDAQATLVNRIRHGVRALKYAGVEQTDWHLNQILCPDVGTLPPGIVFIDFAFALLWLADSNGTPFTSDCQRVRWMLKSETEVNRQVLEEAWFPEDLYED